MGHLRFRVAQRDRLGAEALSRLFVAGGDDIPWSTQTRWDDDVLAVRRRLDDSGCVHVPWRVDGHGQLLLNTGTLMERAQPYLLDVELARGLLQRLRNRLFFWESSGWTASAEAAAQVRAATRLFAAAATRQDDLANAGRLANESLAIALSAAGGLAASYASHALEARRDQPLPGTLLGVSLGPHAPSPAVRRRVAETCNLAQAPLSWRSIEAREGRRDWKTTDEQLGWCQTAGLKIAAGPLLRMDDRGIPDWMYLWEGDYENLARLMLEHVHAVVSRYAGRVHLWHVASRVNNGTLLSLSEEQRLNLVAQTLQLVRKIDPRTPTVVSFDQPWGEYLVRGDEELAPIHYADALVRADLGVSGFGLEINAGYFPRGSAHRPIVEYGRLIDQWSLLGLPLMLLLTASSSAADDPRALPKIATEPAGDLPPGSDDPQHAWAAAVAPLLLTRSNVQVLVWNQLADSAPHEFPHGGLFDADDREKPVMRLLQELRTRHLAS
jgi:hypothetical protein